jgi:hypothetical protein
VTILESPIQDARLALRILRKSPGFRAVAVGRLFDVVVSPRAGATAVPRPEAGLQKPPESIPYRRVR